MILGVDEVQDLLDEGRGVTQIAALYNLHHQTVSRFIKCNNLDCYKAFDEISWKPAISKHELEKSFYIDETFKVVRDKEYLEHLRNIGCDENASTVLSNIKTSLELEAMSMFVDYFEEDEINSALLKEYRHIESYLFRHFGSLDAFRVAFNIDVNLVAYSSDKARSFFIMQGVEFERLVTKALRSMHGDAVITDHRVGGSQPDFVVDGAWMDAKLSKSTALSPACDTISKYLEHADHLTIIYAIDDIDEVPDFDGRVDFVHVTELYPYITDELMNDISELKSAVKQRKGGEII